MDFTIEEEEFSLNQLINKCRFCFRTLIEREQTINIINEFTEKKFYEVTKLKLLEYPSLSRKICQLCNNDLEVFYQFRKDLIRKQKDLYRILKEKEPTIFKENNDFVEHSIENDLVFIKSETNELEEIELKSEKYKSKTRRKNVEKNNHDQKDENVSVLSFCDTCGHETTKIEMEIHMKIHVKKEIFYCEFCSREFEKRHLLNRHIKLKHTEKQRSHFCPTCNKAFFTISTLKKHVESHGAKQMPCEFCGKLFSCMNNLRTHLYYHSEPKFVCEFEQCGKKFFMRKLLKAHLNVHRGQKDYQCSYCEKSYFFQSHLKRHTISQHLKLKIDCEVASCSSSFARKETYRNHVILHHQNLGAENLANLLKKIRNLKVEEFRCVV